MACSPPRGDTCSRNRQRPVYRWQVFGGPCQPCDGTHGRRRVGSDCAPPRCVSIARGSFEEVLETLCDLSPTTELEWSVFPGVVVIGKSSGAQAIGRKIDSVRPFQT